MAPGKRGLVRRLVIGMWCSGVSAPHSWPREAIIRTLLPAILLGCLVVECGGQIEPSAAMEAAIGPKDLWIPVLAESPEYQKLAGPELVLVGRIATGGGYPAAHPERQVWSHFLEMNDPWLPVADLRDCQGPFDKLRGKRTPLEFNHTMVLIKARLKHNRSQGKYPVVVPGWIREIRPDEAEWKLPWPANLPLLPPEREIFSIPLIIACEAASAADSKMGYSGVQHVGQQFKVLEVFHGDAKPGQSIQIRYNYLYINGLGRDVAQGEQVIWVMTGNRDQMTGYAAVPDTPYHRKEAQGLAARVKAAPSQDRFDLADLDLSKVETATTREAELPDLFAESAHGTNSWQLRKEVSVVYSGPDGAVYFVPAKKLYYVRREDYTPAGVRTQPWFFGPFQHDPSLLPAKPGASGAAKETH